ncbi:hypothetical protein Tco_0757284 [Tanacetum coccineum]
MEALTNFNVSEAFEKVVQAKVLTEIKKLLPTHISKAVANYVRLRLNTSMLDVLKTNQINLFTQLSTSTDDLSDMDLKIKLLNRIHSNKSNETHTTHQQLYDTLYESITLDQDALDAQASGSAKRRMTWFDLFLKSDIDKDEDHILGPLTADIAKKHTFWSLNEDILKITVLKTNTPYPSRKIRRICDCTYQRPRRKQDQYALSRKDNTRSDDKEYEFSYVDLPRLSVNDVEDMYLLQVQDKLHHLPLEFVKDFNNALLMFIRITVIKNMVEDM